MVGSPQQPALLSGALSHLQQTVGACNLEVLDDGNDNDDGKNEWDDDNDDGNGKCDYDDGEDEVAMDGDDDDGDGDDDDDGNDGC